MEDITTIIRKRIISSFGELMPEEEFDAHIKKEIDAYFKPRTNPYNGRDVRKPLFEEDIEKAVVEFMRNKIKEYLDSDDMKITWDGHGRKQIPKAIKDMVINNSTAMLEVMMMDIASSMVERIRCEIFNR